MALEKAVEGGCRKMYFLQLKSTFFANKKGEKTHPKHALDLDFVNPEIKTEYMIGKYITGVAPNTTLADFAEKFSVTNGSFKIFGISGYEVSDDNLSTAHTLRIYNTRGVETASYQIAVTGDTNGDGLITSVDLLRMQRQMLSIMEFKGVYLKACDVNLDGVIDVADLIYEQSYILGLA